MNLKMGLTVVQHRDNDGHFRFIACNVETFRQVFAVFIGNSNNELSKYGRKIAKRKIKLFMAKGGQRNYRCNIN